MINQVQLERELCDSILQSCITFGSSPRPYVAVRLHKACSDHITFGMPLKCLFFVLVAEVTPTPCNVGKIIHIPFSSVARGLRNHIVQRDGHPHHNSCTPAIPY